MLNISFFSYKGGSGRTSLLYNTLPFIAEELGASNREPIVVLDLDIDSKGLSYLINEKSEYNAIDVLKKQIPHNITEDIGNHPFFSKLASIGADIGLPKENDNAVLFVSAHPTKSDNKYLNNSDNFDGSQIELKMLTRLCSDMNCKAIIMDAPAGGQVSGRAAMNVSDKIVTVMRITKQFRDGTYEFLKEKCDEYSGKNFIIVPNAVPDDAGTKYSVEKMINEIDARANQSIHNGNYINTAMLYNDGSFGVNEVRSFKFEENILYKSKIESLTPDERSALVSYRKLGKEIVS